MSSNPLDKTVRKECSVCGSTVYVDAFGNGECEHCGWRQSGNEEEFEQDLKISYPNLVPLSRAREQYKRGEPFKATFEDFVNGLFFYAEMIFKYHDKTYGVILGHQREIIFACIGCDEFEQTYFTREEFELNANIDNKLLKDIWDEVENPGFM